MTPRDEWLEWRRQGIGASDIAGILGISPWASPWSVWADKSGMLPPDPADEYMTAGRWLEAAIGPWFTHETGLYVTGEQTWCTHPKWPWVRATPDGFVVESEHSSIDDALGGLEIKILGGGKRWDTIPEHYQAQGQWQMLTTSLERVYFAVLMGRRLDIHELKRDEADIAYMLDKAEQFWSGHVIDGVPPPIDGHDATLAALATLYPTADKKVTVAIDDVAGTLPMLAAAKAAKAAAEQDENAASAVLRWAMKDAYEGTVDGERAVTLGSQTRKTTCEQCGFEAESAPFRVLRPAKGFK
jgi:putative phage-type endonuclease